MAFPEDDEKMKGCRPKLFGTKDKKVVKRADYQSCSAVKSGPSSSKSQSSSPFRTLTEVRSIRLSHLLGHSSSTIKTEPFRSNSQTAKLACQVILYAVSLSYFTSLDQTRSSLILFSSLYRIFVSTWNVGGNTPTAELNLDDFLPADDNSDIYVLGFQEIVPLNAGNVLVVEDNEPAARWLALINRTLNKPVDSNADIFQHKPSSSLDSTSSLSSSNLDASFSSRSRTASGSSAIFQKSSLKSIRKPYMPTQRKLLKLCNCSVEMTRKSYKDACFGCPQAYANETDSSEDDTDDRSNDPCGYIVDGMNSAASASRDQLKYNLISCKRMVGIFITVWAKKELVHHIGHVRTSCIGRGIMGYLGNKGCISVSMTVHQTSFCFICSHLASGEKEGDELRRNLDVLEILRLTQFQRICRAGRRIPEKILDHDRVIWLGDLNYRISLSYEDTKKLLTENNWDALFEKDQLNIERKSGRVFKGWSEEKIYFAPTYKYSSNSNSYAGETATSKKKRRTPAWCDRILWHGDGIVQLSYFRGESKFSDHRPVCGTFIVDVEIQESKSKRRSSNTNIRIGAEELLPTSKSKGNKNKGNKGSGT